jgi:hypothetical protein
MERHEQPMAEVVSVESVGVECLACPRPPHGDEERQVEEHAAGTGVLPQCPRQAGHGDHVDEVVQEFQPGGVPRVVPAPLAGKMQARRPPQRPRSRCAIEKKDRLPPDPSRLQHERAARLSRCGADGNGRPVQHHVV